MKLSKRTINSLLKDIKNQIEEFSVHPIPKCIYRVIVSLPSEIKQKDDDIDVTMDNYEICVTIKRLFPTKLEEMSWKC